LLSTVVYTGKCKAALAQHLASLVNSEDWADVEFILEADGDKRLYGCADTAVLPPGSAVS
jgi:hypothetical protein